ncbi:YphA family membrane protein [Halalkalibacter hemicellulosilyticus]|uniref:Membrane protein n=1 Tax=Halalkalibacter hemicellulosilyticusJCM 9152 TaxID=1236971 RepID=W4QAG6_9BACI|nr:hypothetical protein [Halalkalibacter hemicellulosilyticus]GAE29000.1 membrane protein [Halalkalibacter hemicellulosilyticusJCM 9152]
MDGIFVYWFGWIFWGVVTFFGSNLKMRFWMGCGILLILILLPIEISIMNTSYHLVYIGSAFFLYFYVQTLRRQEKYIYFLFMSLTVSACFAGFRLMLIYDPVIAFIDSRWMLACLVVIICYFLTSTLKKRYILSVSGLIHGEYLLALTPFYHQDQAIGNLYFFDILFITTSLFGVGFMIRIIISWISSFIKSQPVPRSSRQYTGNQLK